MEPLEPLEPVLLRPMRRRVVAVPRDLPDRHLVVGEGDVAPCDVEDLTVYVPRIVGAQPGDVFGLVIKEAAILCVGGIALGIGGAVIVTRWLQSELHGVSPTDPATYIGVAIAIAIVTLAACYAPTRRAMRVDPLIVLRED